jgi:hypothetical protein
MDADTPNPDQSGLIIDPECLEVFEENARDRRRVERDVVNAVVLQPAEVDDLGIVAEVESEQDEKCVRFEASHVNGGLDLVIALVALLLLVVW